MTVAEHHVHDGACKGAVRARLRHHVQVGNFRGGRAVRIDYHELGAPLTPRARDMRHHVDLGGGGVAAPDDDEIGLAHFPRVGSHLGADPGVPARIDERGANGRVLAGIAHDVA
jgi:hypothetical protein